MKKDLAIEEIRAVRHKISARYGHDTVALLQHYKELEGKFSDRILRESKAVSDSEEKVLTREKV